VNRDPTVYLRHLLLCVDRIADYTREGRDAFHADTKTQDAVVRNLEVIGQVVRDAGVEALARADPSQPWPRIAALRNVLAHQYLGVDMTLVWNIVEIEIPRLRAAVESMLTNPGTERS